VENLVTLLVFAILAGLLMVANAGEERRGPRTLTLILCGVLSGGALTIAGLGAIGYALFYAAGGIGAGRFRAAETIFIPFVLAGGLGLLLLLPAAQQRLVRLIPIRPGSPITVLSLTLALLFLAFQLGTQLAVDVLSAVTNGPPLTRTAILVQDGPLFVIAFLGVGLFVRRSLPATARRLGLVPLPTPWWFGVALSGIVVFLLVGVGIDRLSQALTPDVARRVSEASKTVFGQFNTASGILFLAAVAGVAEELLFRGAMLPRFGLILTSLLFAAAHTQYGITFASLEVFILGLGLGWLRLQAGTLACIVLHVGYDVAVGLISINIH
jgi:membrane protease YdiL (CAAX protease family)